MNRSQKTTKFLIILMIIVLVSPVLLAQSEEQMAKFEEEKIAFFTKELQLSDVEAEKFWPVYNDYSNRKMKIGEEEKNLLRYFHSNQDNMSDQEIAESLSKYIYIGEQRYQLETEFFKKFKEILPEKKVLMLYVAERQFRMHLIRRLRNSGYGQGSNERRGGGKGRSSGEVPFPEIPGPYPN